MTMATLLENAPRVLIRHNGKCFELDSERSPMVSGFLKRKPLVFAKTLLTSLMGLCPVSHREVFEAACIGQTSLACGQRVAIEAMLESVRVFAVDWQRNVPQCVIREEALWELGQLRQRLFDALASQNVKDTEHLFVDTQRFVRHFQITYSELLEALLKAVEMFEVMPPLSETTVLLSSQLKKPQTLVYLLEQLKADRFFAVAPRINGARLVGSMARSKANELLDEPLTMKTFILARWMELTRWAMLPSDSLGDFVPEVFDFDGDWRVGVVETVRGPLIHAVKTDGVVLQDFHVIAPTEWVFQSEGVLIERINDFVGRTSLEGQALVDAVSFLASLFDACTDVQVHWGEMHA